MGAWFCSTQAEKKTWALLSKISVIISSHKGQDHVYIPFSNYSFHIGNILSCKALSLMFTDAFY